MNSVRIIDWGYAKSDHAFGPMDVATCMAIDMDRRVRYTRNILFPAEFHDMACILSDFLESVDRLSEPDRLHTILHRWFSLLCEHAARWVGYPSLEACEKDIKETCLLPVQMTRVTGDGMIGWLKEVFPPKKESASRSCAKIPKGSMKFVMPRKGTKLPRVLASVLEEVPYQLRTDTPSAHNALMAHVVREASRSVSSVIEKRAMEQFFSC